MSKSPHPPRSEHPLFGKPLAKSLRMALVYVVFCSFYILYSGMLAEAAAATTQQLKRIELAKGIGFILVTGFVFFLIQFRQWTAIRDKERAIREREKALILSERRAVAAMSSACLAHDLNNLLTIFSGLLFELRSRVEENNLPKTLVDAAEKNIDSLARFSTRIANASLDVYETDVGETFSLAGECKRLLDLGRRHPDVRACVLETNFEADARVSFNPVLFEESVLNLLINAAQAAGRGGTIRVLTCKHADGTALEVHDSGPGVGPEVEERIFEPLFTTKQEGTGLGLMAVKALASHSGARVEVDKSPMGGALFRIVWKAD